MAAKSSNVLVIGGGIAGVQSALDLAEAGIKIHLVDRSPSIGGRMAQLDKTFPTNDCSICILSPKLVEASGHPNIDLIMNSEVIGLDGKAGNFKATVRKHPRYVIEDKCTGCGDCFEKCPVKIPDEFNIGIDNRKAIYMSFLQAVPKKAIIDADHCLKLIKDKCGNCLKVCKAGAIDFEQKKEIIELEVGSIIVATGFSQFNIETIPEYGYKRFANVITAMEFERMLSASGPTLGKLERISDNKPPKKIAFLQCVGSRDVNNLPYCSGVCCMHTIKEAILAYEHDPEIESYIFYMDLRPAGKWFQEYIERGKKDYNVNYIRSRPSEIFENENNDVIIRYEDKDNNCVESLQVDLVVLAQGLISSEGTKTVAEILNLEKDQFGFINIPDPVMKPLDTSVPGIFACGFCQAPMDIPQSVAQASGAAARAAEIIKEVLQ